MEYTQNIMNAGRRSLLLRKSLTGMVHHIRYNGVQGNQFETEAHVAQFQEDLLRDLRCEHLLELLDGTELNSGVVKDHLVDLGVIEWNVVQVGV